MTLIVLGHSSQNLLKPVTMTALSKVLAATLIEVQFVAWHRTAALTTFTVY